MEYKDGCYCVCRGGWRLLMTRGGGEETFIISFVLFLLLETDTAMKREEEEEEEAALSPDRKRCEGVRLLFLFLPKQRGAILISLPCQEQKLMEGNGEKMREGEEDAALLWYKNCQGFFVRYSKKAE